MQEISLVLKAFFGNLAMVFLMGVQVVYVVRGVQSFAFVISGLISTAQILALHAVLLQSPSLSVQVGFVLGGAVGIVLSIRYSNRIAPKLETWFSKTKRALTRSNQSSARMVEYHICHECGHVFHEDYMTKIAEHKWQCMSDCTSDEVMAIRRAEAGDQAQITW